MITESDNFHSRKIQVYLIVAIGPVKIALKDKIVILLTQLSFVWELPEQVLCNIG